MQKKPGNKIKSSPPITTERRSLLALYARASRASFFIMQNRKVCTAKQHPLSADVPLFSIYAIREREPFIYSDYIQRVYFTPWYTENS